MCQRPFFGREPGEQCGVAGEERQGTLVRRKDDEPEAVRKRLEVNVSQTAPVIDWYRQHNANIVQIDALGALDDVEGRMLTALGLKPSGH